MDKYSELQLKCRREALITVQVTLLQNLFELSLILFETALIH
jgi:hypothetical protein